MPTQRPVQYLSQLPGPAGVAQTLELMSRLVKHGKKHPAVRQQAADLTRGLKQKDYLGEIRLIHQFVRDRIRYVRDVRGVETLHYPEIVLEQGYGDCDDKSVLASSMLEAVGAPTRFVAVGYLPGTYCHVLPQVRVGKKWLSVETTEPVELGWFPPNMAAKMVRHN